MVEPTEILKSWPEFSLTPPSEHILNLWRVVSDATTYHGKPAYERNVVVNLITTIASRSYGPDIYRAVHLLAAAAIVGKSVGELIYPKTPHVGTSIFAQLGVRQHTRRLIIEPTVIRFFDPSGNKEQMKLGARQLPENIALIEFLTEALGWDVIAKSYDQLALDADQSNIDNITKDLSSALYRFLGEHLPSANERRLFQTLSDYITAKQGQPNRLFPEDVTDRVIWEFWCDQCTDKAVSFRLYATVAHAWVTFRNAIQMAASGAFSRHISLNHLAETGQFEGLQAASLDASDDAPNLSEASSIGEMIGEIAAPAQWLPNLQEPPCNQIKFLTKVEQDQIEFPLTAGPSAQALLITCLRVALFSHIQNQLVQSQRTGKQADVNHLFTAINDNSYAQIVERWQSACAAAEGLRDTVSFRLWEQRSPLFFTFISDHGSEADRVALSTLTNDILIQNIKTEVSSEHPDALAETLFDAMDKLPKTHALSAHKLQLKDNAHRFRRKGLIPEKTIDEIACNDWCEALAYGGQYISKIMSFMSKLTLRAQESDTELGKQLKLDCEKFRAQFHVLHEG